MSDLGDLLAIEVLNRSSTGSVIFQQYAFLAFIFLVIGGITSYVLTSMLPFMISLGLSFLIIVLIAAKSFDEE